MRKLVAVSRYMSYKKEHTAKQTQRPERYVYFQYICVGEVAAS
jgi:hypothetical protein